MLYELRIQDPSAAGTRYLYEEVVSLFGASDVSNVDAIFAFASANGVTGLVDDPAFHSFITRGGDFELLVGLDAITDNRALEILRDTEAAHPTQVHARVFKSEQPGLFHPKLIRARRDDGSGWLIVGSGNLTPGGMRGNIEAYSALSFDAAEAPDQAEWDGFMVGHAGEISEIDADAIARGTRNAERFRAGRRLARREARRGGARRIPVEASSEEIEASAEEIALPAADDRMLVAEVPGGGGRWQQVHFNDPVIREYFRARPYSPDRLFLFRLEASGNVTPEPPRPVVYSPANKNQKIEFGARPGDPYPTGGRPILVLRELGLRQHAYVMLFPGEAGYAEMAAFLAVTPSVGLGVRRVITTRAEVNTAWPTLPL